MPKRIDNPEDSLLSAAKSLLLEEGYAALTMRQVASLCCVAVGTVYNYFPSKDVLVARILLEDWHTALRSLREPLATVATPLEGLEQVFSALRTFSLRYHPVWAAYSGNPPLRQWHGELIHQIAQCLTPMLERFSLIYAPMLPDFLAQCLLSWAMEPKASFEALSPFFQRLLNNTTYGGNTL